MSNVVPLRRAPMPDTGAAFDAAWKAYPELGRLRSSRKEALKAWAKAAADVGEGALVGAVKRYVAEDKEHKRECGPPAFHRWLNWGRYEHWVADPQSASRPRFADENVRRQVVAATGEDFVGAYLDPCEVDGTVLVPRTGVAIDRLKAYAPLFRSLGFTAMRRRKAPVDSLRTERELNLPSRSKTK